MEANIKLIRTMAKRDEVGEVNIERREDGTYFNGQRLALIRDGRIRMALKKSFRQFSLETIKELLGTLEEFPEFIPEEWLREKEFNFIFVDPCAIDKGKELQVMCYTVLNNKLEWCNCSPHISMEEVDEFCFPMATLR